jgi:hypothetical protein
VEETYRDFSLALPEDERYYHVCLSSCGAFHTFTSFKQVSSVGIASVLMSLYRFEEQCH